MRFAGGSSVFSPSLGLFFTEAVPAQRQGPCLPTPGVQPAAPSEPLNPGHPKHPRLSGYIWKRNRRVWVLLAVWHRVCDEFKGGKSNGVPACFGFVLALQKALLTNIIGNRRKWTTPSCWTVSVQADCQLSQERLGYVTVAPGVERWRIWMWIQQEPVVVLWEAGGRTATSKDCTLLNCWGNNNPKLPLFGRCTPRAGRANHDTVCGCSKEKSNRKIASKVPIYPLQFWNPFVLPLTKVWRLFACQARTPIMLGNAASSFPGAPVFLPVSICCPVWRLDQWHLGAGRAACACAEPAQIVPDPCLDRLRTAIKKESLKISRM